MAAPIVECGTCGNRFPAAHPAGGGICPQCREVVDPPAAAPPAPCPHCGAAVEAGAAACGACGELLGGFGDGPRAGSASVGVAEFTLGTVWRAAWRDWKAHLGTLIGGLLLAGVVGVVLTTGLYFGSLALGFVIAAAVGEPEIAWVPIVALILAAWLAILAVGCWTLCGLTRLHLDAARAGTAEAPGGPDLGRLFAGEGFPRVLLAAATLGTFVTVLVYAPPLLFLGGLAFVGGPGGVGGPTGVVEGLALVGFYLLPWLTLTAAFCLFWPIPFLAVDRPGLRHVRPVFACVTLPAGRWGGTSRSGWRRWECKFWGR